MLALTGRQAMEMVLWTAVVMGAMVALGAVTMWLRHRFTRMEDTARRASLSIDALERMRERGDISDEEFRVLRVTALGLDSGRAGSDNASSSEAPARDDEEEIENNSK